jgi:hypothetical protein
MTSVVVAHLYRVVHDGVAHPPGAIATVPDDVAQRWLTAGWVELAPALHRLMVGAPEPRLGPEISRRRR